MSTGGTGSLPLRESLYSPRGGSRQQRESVYSLRGPNKYRYTDGDSTHTREILETMRGAMATLTGTFDILHEQSTRVAALGPPVDSAAQIQSLRRRVRAQDKRQERRVGELKRVVREVIKDQIAEEMRAQIAEQIRTEMAAQVRSALAVHMGDTPADLRATAQESMRGLVEVRVGLQNSEARRANSILRASNLDEPLATVLLASGKPHELFPGTLRSLFAMDGPSAKTLVQAYDLPVADQREKNLNRFMTHIGLNFNVVPVGVGGHGELMDDGGVTLGITAA
ncbi:hypothetical protein BKA62DRAFT_624119 [Auriculariales sp. MPI-PUGE-AT-0066]|nr:hypothetical protein BKA62DRAFT_624119 [Auriculariales sp. MPI-PUGE-AT-0066]